MAPMVLAEPGQVLRLLARSTTKGRFHGETIDPGPPQTGDAASRSGERLTTDQLENFEQDEPDVRVRTVQIHLDCSVMALAQICKHAGPEQRSEALRQGLYMDDEVDAVGSKQLARRLGWTLATATVLPFDD